MISHPKPGTLAYDWQLIHLARKHPDMPADAVITKVKESQTGQLFVTAPEYIVAAIKKMQKEWKIGEMSELEMEQAIILQAVERWLVEYKMLPPGDSIGG
jgi:hypothetical protein